MTRITEHQLDVLYRRWMLGSDQAVADAMGISRSTIKNTLYTVRLLLNAEDTTQATFLLRFDLMAYADRQSVVLRKRKVAGGHP